MKKLLSLFICVSLAICVLIPIGYTVSNSEKEESALRFCRQVAEMTKNDSTTAAADDAEPEDKDSMEEFSARNFNRLIVKTGEDISPSSVNKVIGDNYSVFEYSSRSELIKEKNRMRKLGYIAEEDGISRIMSSDISSLSEFNEYKSIGADVIKGSYDGTDRQIVIGVLDTGIYSSHNVFDGRLVSSNINLSTSGASNSILDDNGHGTAVASIIAYSTPDNVKIKGYKILNESGTCANSTIVSALDYIASEKNKPDILNLSLGGYSVDIMENDIIYDALRRVINSGVVVCAAAGNENIASRYGNIAGCKEVISVASCNINGESSAFSNYGSDCVDITAIGENVYTADMSGSGGSRKSGTSFSCPFISSACAYILMDNPLYSPAQVENILKSSAINMGENEKYGCGIFNFINIMDSSSLYAAPNIEPGAYDGGNLVVGFNIPSDCELYYSVVTMKPDLKYFGSFNLSENTDIYYVLKRNGKYIGKVGCARYELNYTLTDKDVSIRSNSVISCERIEDKINIVVPNSIGGISINSIGANAFENSNAKRVILGDEITTLYGAAFKNSSIETIDAVGVNTFKSKETFYNCQRLESVNMPELNKLVPYCFYYCRRLHGIDFDKNLLNVPNYSFAYSGILEFNAPEIYSSSYVPKDAFEGSTIMKCNIPNLKKIGAKMFKNAKFLYELDVHSATEIEDSAFYNARYLTQTDLSNISVFYPGALSGCFLEKIYLPYVKNVYEGPSETSYNLACEYVMCRIIDMPNLFSLAEGSLKNSTVEELYLDKVRSAVANAIVNVPMLKIAVFSKANEVFLPKREIEESAEALGLADYATPEFIYAPVAAVSGSVYDCDVLFSGGYEKITLLSGKNKMNIITDNSRFGYNTSVLAPSRLYRANIIYCASGDTSATNVFSFDRVNFKKISKGYATYGLGVYTFSIPTKALCRVFNGNDINDKSNSIRLHLLDVNDDSVLNAKDFAKILKS